VDVFLFAEYNSHCSKAAGIEVEQRTEPRLPIIKKIKQSGREAESPAKLLCLALWRSSSEQPGLKLSSEQNPACP
jgi:hypothetical protein